jgi:hypothetical protein
MVIDATALAHSFPGQNLLTVSEGESHIVADECNARLGDRTRERGLDGRVGALVGTSRATPTMPMAASSPSGPPTVRRL